MQVFDPTLPSPKGRVKKVEAICCSPSFKTGKDDSKLTRALALKNR